MENQKYYEKTFVIPGYDKFSFSIERLSPVKVLPMLIEMSSLNSGKNVSETYEKLYCFALEHTFVSFAGQKIKMKDGEEVYPAELADDLLFFQKVVNIFLEEVFTPLFQNWQRSQK